MAENNNKNNNNKKNNNSKKRNYYYKNGKKIYIHKKKKKNNTNTTKQNIQSKKVIIKADTNKLKNIEKPIKKENKELPIIELTQEEFVEIKEIVKTETKKEKKKKKINILTISIYFIFIPILLFSLYNILVWKKDSDNTEKQIENIQEIVEIEEVKDTENKEIEIIKPKEELPKENPYWDYIKMNLINVNIQELKKKNKDTKGWIQVNGTNINYPFVQGKDNKYYLTHSFDKKYNDAGWVFLDYRNNIKELDKNTIIYAHARKDKTMFGSLRNILKSSWLKNTNNYVIKLSTETENTLWQVFSVYHIPTNSDYIQVKFKDNQEFNTWSQMILNRSQYNFNTKINEDDFVLTLSTCYNDTEKVVLHAKLIKKEARN